MILRFLIFLFICFAVLVYLCVILTMVNISWVSTDDDDDGDNVCSLSTICPPNPSDCLVYKCLRSDADEDQCFLQALLTTECVTTGNKVTLSFADCTIASCNSSTEAQPFAANFTQIAAAALGADDSLWEVVNAYCQQSLPRYIVQWHLRDDGFNAGSSDAVAAALVAQTLNSSSPLAQQVNELQCRDDAILLEGPVREDRPLLAPAPPP